MVLLASVPARAAPEEIQVYMDEMSKQGEFGLDVHNNYVTQGPAEADYPGGLPSLHTYRVTPEFAYGITDNLEGGLYILSALNPHGGYSIGGEKLRLKFIAPKRSADQDWWWGLNFDIDTKVSYRVQPKLALGFEAYDELGDTRHFGDLAHNAEQLFLTADTSFGDWDLNLGVGKGLTSEGDQWIAKFILGVPIDRLFRHH